MHDSETSAALADMDTYTRKLLEELVAASEPSGKPTAAEQENAETLLKRARETDLTGTIIDLFSFLLEKRRQDGISPHAFGIDDKQLLKLARKHEQIDEHLVSVGGRL
ncbi:MAG: hypothetical protein P8X39_12130, partial [Desulfofustis sp.]